MSPPPKPSPCAVAAAALGLMALAIGLRLVALDADPPRDAGRDLALSIDGSWYTGAAEDWAAGRPPGTASGYDPPAFGICARAVFAVLGPGRWAANVLGVLFGLAALICCCAAAWRSRGAVNGLLALALLGLDYAFLVHSRTPSIYVGLAALAAAILLMESRSAAGRRRWRIPAVAAIAVAGIAGFKSIFVLCVLAWALAQPRRLWRRACGRRGLLAAAGGALMLAILCLAGQDWLFAQAQKLSSYFQADGGWTRLPLRVLTLEDRLGLLALSPALPLMALIGALRLPLVRMERCALWMVALHAALLAWLGYSPLRYFLPALPALAVLGARCLSALGRGESALPAGSPARLLLRVSASAYLFLQLGLVVLPAAAPARLAWAAVAAVPAAAALEWALGARAMVERTGLRRAAAAAAIALALAPGLARGGRALANGEGSIRLAGAELARIIDPSVHLTGPFAHVLSQESGHRRTYVPDLIFGAGRLERQLRLPGFTHLLLDASSQLEVVLEAFARDGVPLSLVHEFSIRGQAVQLLRLPWAAELAALSPFEHGIDALARGDLEAALARLRQAHAEEPESSAAAAALGAALLDAGAAAEGIRLLEEALDRNPYELRAERAMLEVERRRGDWRAVERRLMRLMELDARVAPRA
jgi:4-amino-4-deoxy-L-arabinose transferase-like glycosyltransferase